MEKEYTLLICIYYQHCNLVKNQWTWWRPNICVPTSWWPLLTTHNNGHENGPHGTDLQNITGTIQRATLNPSVQHTAFSLVSNSSHPSGGHFVHPINALPILDWSSLLWGIDGAFNRLIIYRASGQIMAALFKLLSLPLPPKSSWRIRFMDNSFPPKAEEKTHRDARDKTGTWQKCEFSGKWEVPTQRQNGSKEQKKGRKPCAFQKNYLKPY